MIWIFNNIWLVAVIAFMAVSSLFMFGKSWYDKGYSKAQIECQAAIQEGRKDAVQGRKKQDSMARSDDTDLIVSLRNGLNPR